MKRVVLVLCLIFGLVSVSGCFSRPTDPIKKEEGGNFDRMKTLPGGGNPKNKGKTPAGQGGAAGSKAGQKQSGD